jgi:putative transposase
MHGRVGHVFQGRFKAIVVQRETHLLELARYVVLNPVRGVMCASPELWSRLQYT